MLLNLQVVSLSHFVTIMISRLPSVFSKSNIMPISFSAFCPSWIKKSKSRLSVKALLKISYCVHKVWYLHIVNKNMCPFFNSKRSFYELVTFWMDQGNRKISLYSNWILMVHFLFCHLWNGNCTGGRYWWPFCLLSC